MARKRKNSNSLTGTGLNNINSSGIVNITLYEGKRKVKAISAYNSGTLDLCQFVIDALSGDAVAHRRPGYITPGKIEGDSLVPMVSWAVPRVDYEQNVTYSGFEDYEDTSRNVKLTFDIPSGVLSAGQEIEGFILYDNEYTPDHKIEYARIILDENDKILVSSNTILRVEWIIRVSYR